MEFLMMNTQTIQVLLDYFKGLNQESEDNRLMLRYLESLYHKNQWNASIMDFDQIQLLDIAIHQLHLYGTSCLALLKIQDFLPADYTLNPQVKNIVAGYEKITSFPLNSKMAENSNYLNLLLHSVDDMRSVLVSIATHLFEMKKTRQDYSDRLLLQSKYIYLPLCHRLGFYGIKSSLEDLILKLEEPEVYSEIFQKLEKTTPEREAFIQDFLKPIHQELQEQRLDYKIKSRTKSIASIYAKMKKQGIPFEEVFDVFAIRIILNSERKNEKSDCWHAYSLVTNCYKPHIERLRDWISKPRDNGYESLHITVETPSNKFVEIQIRSFRMDDEAENGMAAHWRYKGGKADKATDYYLLQIRKTLESSTEETWKSALQIRSGSEKIYAFTPTGELKNLPPNASVLDFAFAIHTEVGVRCSGARINGRFRPIKTKLSNGDRVEIITNKLQKPTMDWLNIVQSSRAKSRIKKAMDEQNRLEATEGKEMLIRRLKNWKMEFSQEIADKLFEHFKPMTVQEIYRQIFQEKIGLNQIKKILVHKDENLKEEKAEVVKEQNRTLQEDALVVDELDHIGYRLGKCCKPVPGDSIFGFVTIARGITIHRTKCSNAKSMHSRYPYRIIPARWKALENLTNFRAELFLKGMDKQGIFNEISNIISVHAHLISINLHTIGNIFQGNISVKVANVEILNLLIQELDNHKDIMEVYRKK